MLDMNKITSNLQFVGSTILKLNIDNGIAVLGTDATKSFDLDIKISNHIDHNQNTLFGKVLVVVSVSITIPNNDKKNMFQIAVEGGFQSDDGISEEEFKKQLAINGAAALYSIVRAKMETVSAATFSSGKIILPVINIYQYYEEKQKAAAEAQSKNGEN